MISNNSLINRSDSVVMYIDENIEDNTEHIR